MLGFNSPVEPVNNNDTASVSKTKDVERVEMERGSNQRAVLQPGDASATSAGAPVSEQTDPNPPDLDAAGAAPPPKKPLPTWLRFLRNIVLLGFAGALTGALSIAGLFVYHGRNLPEFATLKDYNPPQSTKLLGIDGSVVGEFFEERRTVVAYGEIPKVMIQAITAAEDGNFFEHGGVDYIGIVKALIVDMIPGTHKRGASTLTQQTVKNMLLSNERKLSRKIKEIILAQRLEKHLTKEEILHIYLNQIYFGHKRYGIEEAAQFYFGHGVKELTLGEAAMLASTPKSPNEINPITNPTRLKERQTYVLRRMVELGFISAAVAEREIAKPIPQPPKRPEAAGDYYVDEVKRQLLQKFDPELIDKGGLRVETMMNPQAQAAAEAAMHQGLRDLDKRQGWRGPLGRLDDGVWTRIKSQALARLKEGSDDSEDTAAPVSVLDLRRIDSKPLATDPSDDRVSKAAKAAQWKRAAPGTEIVARVQAVTKTGAEVDLGSNTTALAFSTVTWARKYNPSSMTAQPKSMFDVVKDGDLVRVRITKIAPCEEADKKKGSCKGPKVEVALEQEPQVQGALVSIDPKTRAVVALVGGYEFDAKRNAFNRATQAKRQPGSSFKPFVYAAALEVGQQRAQLLADPNHPPLKSSCVIFTPRQQVNDAPEYIPDHWSGKPWIPHNFERDSFDGFMSLRRALAASKNTVAVKLVEQVGCEPTEAREFSQLQSEGLARVKELARRVGIDSPIPNSLTAALGSGEVIPMEITNAYATFAANGQYAPPQLIKRVVGPDGKVLLESKPAETPDTTRGISPELAYVTTSLMRSVVESPEGTARAMQKLGRPIAGKTGTASEHRDAWFVGYTPELVTSVWVGFDDHGQLGGRETGGHAAGPIWMSYMKAATDKIERREFPMPPGVVVVDIDPRNGLLADPKSPYLEREYYLPGTEPTEVSQPDQLSPEDFMRGEVP